MIPLCECQAPACSKRPVIGVFGDEVVNRRLQESGVVARSVVAMSVDEIGCYVK